MTFYLQQGIKTPTPSYHQGRPLFTGYAEDSIFLDDHVHERKEGKATIQCEVLAEIEAEDWIDARSQVLGF